MSKTHDIVFIHCSCLHTSASSSFILKVLTRNSFPFLQARQQEHSARSSSSVAAYNSSVHREKAWGRRMSVLSEYGKQNLTGTWRIPEWENWRSFDRRQPQVECVFLCCFPPSSQCVRDGCGSDASLFSIRIQELASCRHEPLRKAREIYLKC